MSLIWKYALRFPKLKSPIKSVLRNTFTWQHSFLVTRGDLPFVLNAMNLLGTGAEIGVRNGEYSHFLLTHWKGEKLFSIDSWAEAEEYIAPSGDVVSQSSHDEAYGRAVMLLAPFGARSMIVREDSLAAAEKFADGSLDFCYIDAAHQYEPFKKDLAAWFPKVKRGGIVSGHDYSNAPIGAVRYGVKRAVDEFCRENHLKLTLTREFNVRSWFIFK